MAIIDAGQEATDVSNRCYQLFCQKGIHVQALTPPPRSGQLAHLRAPGLTSG